MKKKLFLLMLALIVAFTSACKPSGNSGNPNDNSSSSNDSSSVVYPPHPDKDNLIAEGYDLITVETALEICGDVGNVTTERYYLLVTIDSILDSTFGEMTVSDATGSIHVFGAYGADGSYYSQMKDKPIEGDKVLLHCILQNRNGTKEVKNARIIAFEQTKDDSLGEGYDVITVTQALELCGEEGNITTERYYLLVTVDSVTNATYGEMTVSDETGSIYVYGSYSADGSIGYAQMEDKPYKGDKVLLHCILQNHNGTKEVKNARIIAFEHSIIDGSAYTKMSIEQARNAEVGAKVTVEGVVAAITYANGMKPSGVYLVDGTSSIYVYGADVAARVQKGNKIVVNASKTYWILESEQAAAAKHGYKGCNQLEDATLVSNDGNVNEYDKSWIRESTVKKLIETPVDEDVTTLIYKVNALVRKVEGTSFTNYYFFDLDGETGSYTYTQCNGSDFSWIDAFDGKICTVYLSAINAKSSATDCVFRLLPVEIIDEGFTFDLDKAPQFAVEYYALDNFKEVYTADPATTLITSVSSDLLGFEEVALTYSSDNTEVAYFENRAEGVVFHLAEYGNANITITAEYNGKTYSKTLAVRHEEPASYKYITVAEAIKVAPNTENSEVIVKGIVGPSVVNKNGFYFFGEDGSVITVLVASTDYFADLSIGNTVILKGIRERYIKDDSYTTAGQTSIVDAEILVNYYGNTAYSTEKFTNISGANFNALDVTVDYSTNVYIMTGKVELISTDYYTSMKFIAEDGKEIKLYMAGAGQYSFLNDYAGKTVTVEIAACNWNDKTDVWRGCILAVYNEDGTKTLNTLNFDSY